MKDQPGNLLPPAPVLSFHLVLPGPAKGMVLQGKQGERLGMRQKGTECLEKDALVLSHSVGWCCSFKATLACQTPLES